jgi:ATP/maltotriose-dependent transcriptional regulator MalT
VRELRSALEQFKREKQVPDEVSAHSTLAETVLALGRLGEAKAEITQATGLTARNESRKVRLQTEIVAAQVRAADGKPDSAAHDLRLTIKDAQKSGFFVRQMEASLALAGIETRSGKKKEARSLLQSVEKDARSKGFLLIARKAAAASR